MQLLSRCSTINQGPVEKIPKHQHWLKDRISIRTDGKIILLRISEILFVRAAGNYIEIHITGQKFMIRETMNGILKRLSTATFVRIHRSVIINIEYIAEVMSWYNGELRVVMTDGRAHIVSRNFKSNIDRLLEAI